MRRAAALLIVAAMACTPCLSRAGELQPGATATGYEDYGIHPPPPEAEWRGALLAEREEPFRIEWQDTRAGRLKSVEGVFASRVYRDAGTGGAGVPLHADRDGAGRHL